MKKWMKTAAAAFIGAAICTAAGSLSASADVTPDGDTLILAGSIPNSLPDDIYERILERLSGKQIRTVVDATGGLLLNVLKYRPFLVKPNNKKSLTVFQAWIHYSKPNKK